MLSSAPFHWFPLDFCKLALVVFVCSKSKGMYEDILICLWTLICKRRVYSDFLFLFFHSLISKLIYQGFSYANDLIFIFKAQFQI